MEIVPLGHLRNSDNLISKQEQLSIAWTKDGKFMPQFDNQTLVTFKRNRNDAVGTWVVIVQFLTEEVRVTSQSMTDTMTLRIPSIEGADCFNNSP